MPQIALNVRRFYDVTKQSIALRRGAVPATFDAAAFAFLFVSFTGVFGPVEYSRDDGATWSQVNSGDTVRVTGGVAVQFRAPNGDADVRLELWEDAGLQDEQGAPVSSGGGASVTIPGAGRFSLSNAGGTDLTGFEATRYDLAVGDLHLGGLPDVSEFGGSVYIRGATNAGDYGGSVVFNNGEGAVQYGQILFNLTSLDEPSSIGFSVTSPSVVNYGRIYFANGQSGDYAIQMRFSQTETLLGFYNAQPVARPTGVAVTAAGIHAALVTLGLIAT